MTDFFNSSGGVIAGIALIIIAVNTILTGIYKALELIKDKTKSDWDNKLYSVLTVVIGWIQKIIEIISANPTNKKS